MPVQSKPSTDTYWTELRIFLQVAHTHSFNKAGADLGVTHVTVARAVRRLETAMGVQLVADAAARGVKLTDAGAKLAEELAGFDQRLSEMLRATKEEVVETTLPANTLAALDQWIESHPEPRPSRSDAVRTAVHDWLTGQGLLKHRDDPEGANGRDA